jgi:hypothetical protein
MVGVEPVTTVGMAAPGGLDPLSFKTQKVALRATSPDITKLTPRGHHMLFTFVCMARL